MKNDKLISIIIPVYNGSDFLEQAIQSAINQTYKNIEIIVVNDGSNDGGLTEQICLKYSDKIKYYYKDNGGVSSALNFGIKKMAGDYFSWLSHDDLYSLDHIERMVANLNPNCNDEILFSNYAYIDEFNKILYRTHFEKLKKINDYSYYAFYRGLLCGLTLLIPKEAFFKIGFFDENLRCVQDYMLFFKFLSKYKYRFINYCTSFSRIHSKQVTLTNKKMQEENDLLWKYIIDNSTKDVIAMLGHDEYNFYNDIAKYLKYNNISLIAYDYCIKKRDEFPVSKHHANQFCRFYPITHFCKLKLYLKKDGLKLLFYRLYRRFYEKKI